MAVNNTSRTPTAPRTSFARRDSVGTGTGGRMATSGLLQLQSSGAERVPARAPLFSTTHRAPPGSLLAHSFPHSRCQAGTGRTGRGQAGSAAGGRAARLEVGEGLQGIVEVGDLGQRE